LNERKGKGNKKKEERMDEVRGMENVERERENAYVMKEVRASVCSASAFKAVSRYPGTLPIGRRIESAGLTDG
jgi:hypothetical protein